MTVSKVAGPLVPTVPSRIIDLGMWLTMEISALHAQVPQPRRYAWWRAQMRMALRIQGWCNESDVDRMAEATFRRLLAWFSTTARSRGLEDLQSTVMDLRGGCAYICAIVGAADLEPHGSGLAESALWNAYADVLCGLAKVTRSHIGWTLPDTPKPRLALMPEPGPLALADLAAHDPFYAAMRAEWDALLPRLMALCTAEAA